MLYHFQKQPTCAVSDVHNVFREPAILNGYRLNNKSWCYYLHSLFQIHNETGNVWSHLIGCFVIFYFMAELSKDFDLYTDKDIWPVLIFGASCIMTCFISAMVHLFHSKSIYVNYLTVMLDNIGISLYGFGTGIIAMYSCSHPGFYRMLEPYFLPLITASSYFLFLILCIGKIKFGCVLVKGQRKVFVGAGIILETFVIFIPFFPRYISCMFESTCSLYQLNYISVTLVFFFLQAVFYSSHLPEKWWPGKCDIFPQGHQLFHVIHIITVILQFRTVYNDIETGHTIHTQPNIVYICLALAILCVTEFLSLIILRKFIPEHEKQS